MAGHFGIDAEGAVKSCGDGGDQFQNSSLKFAIVWVCCKPVRLLDVPPQLMDSNSNMLSPTILKCCI